MIKAPYSIKNKTVETKTFHFQLKSINEDVGTVTGYLSTFGNVDLQKDKVLKGSFKKTLLDAYGRKKAGRKFLFPILWMHDPEQPIGGFVDASEDAEGLLVTAQLDISTNTAGIPNNPVATMVFSGFKSGYVDEMSMGYIAIQKEFDGGVRNLKEVQLVEGSAVTMLFAANPEALIPSSGVKKLTKKEPATIQKKDFNDLFQAAQAADSFEDWGDLINTLTQSMIQIFGMGDSPQADMTACLEQFNAAVMAWVEDAVSSDLAGYINDRGYCDAGSTPYVPASMRPGGYDSMSRPTTTLQGAKSGATISAATQGTLEQHQAEMKALIDQQKEACKSMQQKVADLTQLWQQEGQGQPYANDDGKSRARREPTAQQPLTRKDVHPFSQPLLQQSTVEMTIDELENLFI